MLVAWSEHVLNKGHEIKTIEETMSITNQENNHRKVNTPEVIEKVHNIVLDINCNTFYIGRTNRNFNTRFKEHRKDFRYAEGKSKFSEHVLSQSRAYDLTSHHAVAECTVVSRSKQIML